MRIKSPQKKKHDFSDLLLLAKTMRTKNKWHQNQTIERFSKYLIEEAREIHSAAQKKDWEEVQEEIEDMLWDLAFLTCIAEEKQLFSIHDSIHTAVEKIRRRNPHILAGKNEEELRKQYQEIKRQEKLKKRSYLTKNQAQFINGRVKFK